MTGTSLNKAQLTKARKNPPDRATPTTTNDAPGDVLDGLLHVFSAKGFDGASLIELAAACNRSKASLYHHFPGGKKEMIELLVARCQTTLEQEAFAHLHKVKGKKAARRAVDQFVQGFANYLDKHEGHCLLATLALTQPELLGDQLRPQLAKWQTALSQACEQLGHKPKPANRLAQASLARLYGSLTLAAMGSDISINQACKWLKRDLLR